MQVLTAAVTPVVLVSATAILISGTNARYISISDRIRALAHEYREPNCTVHLENLISQRNQPVSSKEVGTLHGRYERYQRAQQTAFEFPDLTRYSQNAVGATQVCGVKRTDWAEGSRQRFRQYYIPDH
jgi:hypothetical protein